MADSFIPLCPRQEIAARAGQAAAGEQSMFSPLQVSARNRGLAAPPTAAPCGTPSVSLKRDGDKITHIRVQCGCGEVIELACVY